MCEKVLNSNCTNQQTKQKREDGFKNENNEFTNELQVRQFHSPPRRSISRVMDLAHLRSTLQKAHINTYVPSIFYARNCSVPPVNTRFQFFPSCYLQWRGQDIEHKFGWVCDVIARHCVVFPLLISRKKSTLFLAFVKRFSSFFSTQLVLLSNLVKLINNSSSEGRLNTRSWLA